MGFEEAIFGAIFGELTVDAAVSSVIAGISTSSIIATGLKMGLMYGLSALASPSAPAAVSSNSSYNISLNSVDNVGNIPVIYGERGMVGGLRVFTQLTGSESGYLHLVTAVCEGEISQYKDVSFNQVLSTDAKYNNLFHMETFNGTSNQSACSFLVNEISTDFTQTSYVSGAQGITWNNSCMGKGVAYIYTRFLKNNSAFPGIPEITATIKGKLVRIYNNQNTLTYTTAYSQNPAWCILDYLMNTLYGKGLTEDEVDIGSFMSCADYCDTTVAVTNSDNSISNRKRYVLNGYLDTSQTILDNLTAMLTSCRGMLIKSGTSYKMRIDQAEPVSTLNFNSSNIIGQWTIDKRGKAERYNQLKGSFYNNNLQYQTDYAIIDSQTFRDADGGMLLSGEVSFPFTSDSYIAKILTGLALKESRYFITCSFTAMPVGIRCEIGDVVTVSHAIPGWTKKPFRVIKLELLSTHEVIVTLKEYDVTMYDLSTLTVDTQAQTCFLPTSSSVVSPSGVVLSTTSQITTSSTTLKQINITWTPVTYDHIDHTEIWYKASTDAAFVMAGLSKIYSNNFITPIVQEGTTYQVKLRHVNALGIKSDFSSIYSISIPITTYRIWNAATSAAMWSTTPSSSSFWSV